MSSSLGPAFRARKKETPVFVTPDEVQFWEEKYFEINDEPVEIPPRMKEDRFLNLNLNADGMIDDI